MKLICCDIDGTLINDALALPESNLSAIEDWRAQGGLFTVATGRTNDGARRYLDIIKPDTPIICHNGSSIYDCKKGEFLWLSALPESVKEAVAYVDKRFPGAGIEIITPRGAHFCKENDYTRKHVEDEGFPYTVMPYEEVSQPWLKCLFASSPEDTDILQEDIEKNPFFKKYNFKRSYTTYYECMEKHTNKAVALKRLAAILEIKIEDILVIGDNDNDTEMLSLPCTSFAPRSASQKARKSADYVLKADNNDGIVREVLSFITNRY